LRLAEKEQHRLADQRLSLAEEVFQLVGESVDRGDILNARLFIKLAKCRREIVFAFFDMAFGVIPESAVVEQQVMPLAGLVVPKDDEAGGSFVAGWLDELGCWMFYEG
jgi:hypothetical protein